MIELIIIPRTFDSTTKDSTKEDVNYWKVGEFFRRNPKLLLEAGPDRRKGIRNLIADGKYAYISVRSTISKTNQSNIHWYIINNYFLVKLINYDSSGGRFIGDEAVSHNNSEGKSFRYECGLLSEKEEPIERYFQQKVSYKHALVSDHFETLEIDPFNSYIQQNIHKFLLLLCKRTEF